MRKVFLAVGRFEQTFERGALWRRQLFGALRSRDVLRSGFRGALGLHHEQFVARIAADR